MGNNVIIAVGEASRNFHGMVQLNDSAAEIWKHIEKGCSREQIVNNMLDTYEAERELIELDVDKVVKMLAENGLIEL